MKISEHAERTQKLFGIRAEDIHKWIDGLFDVQGFTHFLRTGRIQKFDPYAHRKHRHCKEALEDAYREFEGKYSKKDIKNVFETHIRDDYNGYLPTRIDFENGTFTEKYHENEDRASRDRILSATELADYFQGKSYAYSQNINGKQSSRFGLRIVLPTILAIILFVTSIFILIVPVYQQTMMTQKREMIRELTTAAASAITYYIHQAESGEMTLAEAQRAASDEVAQMRYGEDHKDYFWITTMHPRMVMHPYRPDLEGQDLTNYRDSEDRSGKRLFVEFVDLVQADGHGYLKYFWQWKDDPSRTAPKLSYVMGIPEWDWIIGTGVYIDDVETESNRLIKSLSITFAGIAVVLFFILLNVVLQSRDIEANRQRAETGLHETKERYRALVEASNEGYILVVGGETIYSNLKIQQLTEYSEEELRHKNVWDLLDPEFPDNADVLKHLRDLLADQVGASEFSTRLATKFGKAVDVIVTTSKIFFTEKIGYVISFRPLVRSTETISKQDYIESLHARLFTDKVRDITILERHLKKEKIPGISEDAHVIEAVMLMQKEHVDALLVLNDKHKPIGKITYKEVAGLMAGDAAILLYEISDSNSSVQLIRLLEKFPALVYQTVQQQTNPAHIRQIIGQFYDTTVKKLIEFNIAELGEPPCDFAFISLGSNSRHEMTLFSDQDNALIYDAHDDEGEVQAYFLSLADAVCTQLDQAGFPRCPGGIMAVNPKWCLNVEAWKKNFKTWITNPTPESILEMNVFLDLKCVYGQETLVKDLHDYVFKLSAENPQVFLHFARNCLLYKPPLNLFGQIRANKHDGMKTINIKDSIKPIELFARIYTLKNGIQEISTLDRLTALAKQKLLPENSYDEMVYAFNYLWRLRFENQMTRHSELRQVNDELDLGSLTDIELQNLHNVISAIPGFQSRLSYDFLGVGIS